MNENLKIIYDIIQPKVDIYNSKPILGNTIATGIELYLKLKSDLSGDGIVDYAEIIVESLDKEILNNNIFLEFFIKHFLEVKHIDLLSKNLNISDDLSNIKKRRELLTKTKNELKKNIIIILLLDENYFKEQSNTKTISSESIIPYTPVPIDEPNSKDLISKEYLSLHDYQKNIKDSVIRGLIFSQPNAKLLVHMPTGSGKTKTAIEAIIDFIRVSIRLAEDGGTIIWFAHSKELCEQAYNTFKALWRYKGDYPINIYKYFGDSDEKELINCTQDKASIVFCGFQKFRSIYKSNYQQSVLFELKHFFHTNTKLVIVDEAHISQANTYKEAIEFVNQMPNCRLMGLTATPGRSNFVEGDNQNNNLADFFGNNIIKICDKDGSVLENPLKYLQERKILAKIIFEELDFNLDLKKMGYKSSQITNLSKKDDIGDDELDLIAIDPNRNAIIITKVKECYIENDSILVFACTKEHCIILQRLLKLEGIESAVILGDTNKSTRANDIESFKKNELKVLINFGVLSTGFDAPNLNTLIMARPTKSIVLYSQIVGRALRGKNNGGNLTNKIITIKDNMIGFPNPDFMFDYWRDFWN
jgi:superfamily II DNA or RNA helicase